MWSGKAHSRVYSNIILVIATMYTKPTSPIQPPPPPPPNNYGSRRGEKSFRRLKFLVEGKILFIIPPKYFDQSGADIKELISNHMISSQSGLPNLLTSQYFKSHKVLF